MNKNFKIVILILSACLLGSGIFLTILISSQPSLSIIDSPAYLTTGFNDPVQKTCTSKATSGDTCDGEFPSGCSVFTVSKGDQVLFGGNDDYINPDSYYWVDPEGHGVIWIGRPDNVQQGVNTKGLAYDANGLPRVDVNPHLEGTPVSGGYSSYPVQIMRECATVEEVIAWVNSHQWHSFMHDQLHFADATGDAVVISAGADGELAFTRKPQGDGSLVSTNFNLANPSNAVEYPSWRYDTAQEMLGKLVNQEGNLSFHDAAGVLEAVHVADLTGWTLESMVADLTNGIVYLYYFHQFDEPVVLNVAEEIANERAGGALSKLFPENVQQEAARRYERIQEGASRCQVYGIVWLGLVLTSLIVLLIATINNRQGIIFWIPVVVILGPVGLLIWLAVRGKLGNQSWPAVLLEITGDVAPIVVAFVIFLVVVILVPAVQNSEVLEILLIFVFPPLIGLILFHTPLLNAATTQGYLHTLWRRFPQAWVTANLGMAGIFLLGFPLVNNSLQYCSVSPLNPRTLLVWWGFAVLGALVAMLLLLVYEGWAVRQGFHAWSILASAEGELVTPTWRNLWWWILLSIAILLAGVAAGVMI